MELWIAFMLLVIFIGSIAAMCVMMKNKEDKKMYIIGIVIFSVLTLAASGYILLTALLLGGIQ